MRYLNHIGAAILSLSSLALSSCLHDDTDYFDGVSAAERAEQAEADVREILTSAPNGWRFSYYYGEDYAGGFTFLCSFNDKGKVSVSADIFSPYVSISTPETVCSSSYDIVHDMGPVLTFNTGNDLIHYFAKPYQGDVDGDQGDYEFIILSYSADEITLKGKKWGNKMTMVPMTEGVKWSDYLSSIQEITNSMPYAYTLTAAGAEIGTAEVDVQTRRLAVKTDSTVESAYIITPEGIELQSPMTIGGQEVTKFTYSAATQSLTAGSVTLAGYTPSNMMTYEAWTGQWLGTVNYSGSEITILLDMSKAQAERMTAAVRDSCVISLSTTAGILEYHLYCEYDKTSGQMSFPAQYCQDPSGEYNYLMMIPAALVDGYYYFNISGALTMVMQDDKKGSFGWDGNGKYEVNSMLFMACDNSGNLIVQDDSYVLMNQIPSFKTFERYE